MPTIVEPNAAVAELLSSAVSSHARTVPSLGDLKQLLADGGGEHAIVLGPSVDLDAAAALADTLRVTHPGTGVILVRRRVDTAVLAEALRSGMREVVEERDLTGLTAAVQRAGALWAALQGQEVREVEETTGRVLTVFSPKGGVGKTTLAVNTALALSTAGDHRVCLVDLDLGFGDVAITLQLMPTRTIADAVHLQQGLDVATLETLLTAYGENLSTLVAPVQPDAKETIPAALVGTVLRLLRSHFDFVVVDTAPSFDEHVLQAFDESDEIVLVTTLDVPTLKNVKVAIETLELLNFPATKLRLVLNRADEKVGLTSSQVESTLGMDIAVSVPSSPQVASATNAGDPIVRSSPRHPASLAISSFAGDISGSRTAQPQRSKKHTAVPSGRRGLLRRTAGKP
jgi:pilus assembly protein CpaE